MEEDLTQEEKDKFAYLCSKDEKLLMYYLNYLYDLNKIYIKYFEALRDDYENKRKKFNIKKTIEKHIRKCLQFFVKIFLYIYCIHVIFSIYDICF